MSPYAHLGQCIIVGGLLVAVVWWFVVLVRSDLEANPAPEDYDDEYLAEIGDQDGDELDDYRDGAYTGDEWDRAYDREIDRASEVV